MRRGWGVARSDQGSNFGRQGRWAQLRSLQHSSLPRSLPKPGSLSCILCDSQQVLWSLRPWSQQLILPCLPLALSWDHLHS